MTLTVVPFFSALAQKNLVDRVLKRLAAAGAQVMHPDVFQRRAEKRDKSLPWGHTSVFVGTGGTERDIARFLSNVRLPSPILLLSHDGNNSLPAAMETRTYLQQRGVRARIIHAPLDRLVERLGEWRAYARIEDRIRASRLGLIGKPSPWLVASRVSPAKVRRRWGLTVARYPIATLLTQIDNGPLPRSKAALQEFINHALRVKVSREELTRAGALADALEELVRTRKLDAVAVECFTLLEETGITGCYALSRLNDLEGVAGGCEGDVPATFTLMIARLLTKRPAFMANVTDVDLDANSAVFAHCTAAITLLDAYDITTHFESGKSVAVQGQLKPQPVTVLKVLGEDLSRYWVSSGDIIAHQSTTTGCRTQVRVKLAEPVSYFLEQSLGNHHVLVLGNYARMLREFFEFVLRE